ncbi:hypothetical protein KFK09_009795 [Dendrobium nobile]|uniref:Bidirectional sugar transporter SWEET n=1 Tax=Dendrobium nobile TaxID=94219 RepID=A0A8T3BL01_DENNO|nr:hypothetical protein KFK09_009795 [Dendrobium nobile]
MISAGTLRTIVGIVGNVIALGLFLSPLPTFIRIWKKKSVDEFSVIPYVATLLNCMLWMLYGLPIVHPNSTLVLTINCAGAAIEICYVILYLVFSNGPKRFKAVLLFLGDLVFVGVVAIIVLIVFHTHERRSLVVGILCVIFCIIMYLAPLSVMKMVIKTKSVEYMPLSLSVASFLNGLCWTIYALIRFDLYITIPNVLGLLFSITQLVLQALYYKSTKRQIAERKLKGEVGLTDVVIDDSVKPSHKFIFHGSPVLCEWTSRRKHILGLSKAFATFHHRDKLHTLYSDPDYDWAPANHFLRNTNAHFHVGESSTLLKDARRQSSIYFAPQFFQKLPAFYSNNSFHVLYSYHLYPGNEEAEGAEEEAAPATAPTPALLCQHSHLDQLVE